MEYLLVIVKHWFIVGGDYKLKFFLATEKVILGDDPIRLPVVDHPTEVKELTVYKDNELLAEVEGGVNSRDLWEKANPFDKIDIGPVLARSYELQGFTWSTEARFDVIKKFNFPNDLISQPQIQEKLKWFSLLRFRSLRLGVRINSTMMHYGRLAVSYMVGQGESGSTSYHCNTLGVFQGVQQLNNRPTLISAMTEGTVEIDIPWTIPEYWLPLTTGAIYGAPPINVDITVLAPLGTSADVLTACEVSVFASMVDPEVAGPILTTMTTYGPLPQILTIESHSRSETKKKSEDKTMVSDVQDFVNTAMTVIKLGESISEFVGPLMAALDKPTSVAATTPVSIQTGRDMLLSEGVDNGTVLALKPMAELSNDSHIMAGWDVNPSLLKVLMKPGYYGYSSLSTSTIAGYKEEYTISPMMCFTTIDADFKYYCPTFTSWFTPFYTYWRGSMRMFMVFTTSKFNSCRVRLSYVPGYSYTGYDSGNSNGDVYSRVVEINGDTEVTLEFPYLYPTHFRTVPQVGTDSLTGYTGALGVLRVEVLNPLVTTTSTNEQLVHWDMWVGAGPDFQLSGYTGAPFSSLSNTIVFAAGDPTTDVIESHCSIESIFDDPFEPIATAFGFTEENYMMNEPMPTIVEMGKRFFNCSSKVATISPGIYRLELVDSMTTPSELFSLSLLLAPFVYHRGAMRYKIFPYIAGAPGARISVSVGPVSTHGPKPMEYMQVGQDMIEGTLPYYNSVPYRRYPDLGTSESLDYVYFETISASVNTAFTAFGDDFSVSCPLAPPVIRRQLIGLVDVVTSETKRPKKQDHIPG